MKNIKQAKVLSSITNEDIYQNLQLNCTGQIGLVNFECRPEFNADFQWSDSMLAQCQKDPVCNETKNEIWSDLLKVNFLIMLPGVDAGKAKHN